MITKNPMPRIVPLLLAALIQIVSAQVVNGGVKTCHWAAQKSATVVRG
ncbi:hypothetical protein [Paracoccus sp. MKU1]|nr:hypothetical protein [Paracoccus sp. MKU1]